MPESVSARAALCDVAALFYENGWAFGTSGNYSVVESRDPLRLLITASGRDKRGLTERDFVVVDERGAPAEPASPTPSAETLLHCLIARLAGAGAVLHTHSVWNTLISQRFAAQGFVLISGLEMLKGLRDIRTHEAECRFAIVPNTQDIHALAESLRPRFERGDPDLRHAFLMAGHGLYTWGVDLAEARRHVEILEFLFEIVARAARN